MTPGKPIFSFFTPRHELGGATKGTIYLSKFGIGAGLAFVLWMSGLSGDAVMGNWRFPVVMLGLFLPTYPYSDE